ncbi:MAG: deoxyguanosinetriphosphate triphosphohydrolase [Dysgonamonadaceae bacterium]|jgi:dGTPase|nr:deoxyguanosinetriphosphate triphosphohydrolase [Dysgonamonadaceae bacterium]
MNWEKLLSDKRFGMESYHEKTKRERTDFQRDYDRLIFSAPFRRLQNKTQVFPLPGSIFVHNRLTHSLEVACVGRSLGDMCGKQLFKSSKQECFALLEMGSIVSAACLAHDLGNPPFGHSGEEAISTYFSEGNGKEWIKKLQSQGERVSDFTHFEGNANSLRLLTHQFNGRREGGFAMTYSTLSSIVKYPYTSLSCDPQKGKFGFFASEESDYQRIANELGLIKINETPLQYARHPLVYLVEAADDICYQIMDIEDAHKLKLLSTEECIELMLHFFPEEKKNRALKIMSMVDDKNEKMAYLRSSVIGILIDECSRIFIENETDILQGRFDKSLIKYIGEVPKSAYMNCSKIAVEKIYRSQIVVDIELAGFRIIGFLLDCLLDAVRNPGKKYSELLIKRIPEQYEKSNVGDYTKTQAVIDYISGMTDIYALDLYRKITGMSLPSL